MKAGRPSGKRRWYTRHPHAAFAAMARPGFDRPAIREALDGADAMWIEKVTDAGKEVVPGGGRGPTPLGYKYIS